MRHLWIGSLSLLVLVALGGTAAAVPITVPTSLNPGNQYRLSFLTSTTHPATSTSIADYNAFVTGVANSVSELAALGTTWNAIGSTSVVDARDNTGTNPGVGGGVPIYLLNDTQLAVSNNDLWDGTIGVPLRIDENGSLIGGNVFAWTGTDVNGAATALPLGSTTGGTIFGQIQRSDFAWISSLQSASTTSRPIYAMSGTLTVVPEPGSGVLLSLGLVGLAVGRRRSGS